MLVNDKAANARLNSPMNLMNKLKSLSAPSKRGAAMGLFGMGKDKVVEKVVVSFNPFEKKEDPPSQPTQSSQAIAVIPATTPTNVHSNTTLDNILENHDSQIKLGLAHDNALKLLNDSVALLATKLDDVKADKLPGVVAAASKVVESIRKERNEATRNNKDREVHYHFYTPEQKTISDYEVIEVQ